MQRYIPIKLDEEKSQILAEAAFEGEVYGTVLEIKLPPDAVDGFVTIDFQLLYNGDVFISEPIPFELIEADDEVIIGNRDSRIIRYAVPPMVTRIAGNVPFQFTIHTRSGIFKGVKHLFEVMPSINANPMVIDYVPDECDCCDE